MKFKEAQELIKTIECNGRPLAVINDSKKPSGYSYKKPKGDEPATIVCRCEENISEICIHANGINCPDNTQ